MIEARQDSDGEEKLNPGGGVLKKERKGLGDRVWRVKEGD